MKPRVFTVGHGARPIDELLSILDWAGVTTLADIRRFPGSRRHPQFGRDALAGALAAGGIAYVWRGESLGGRRSRRPVTRHTALRNEAFGGYADHMDSPEFRQAVTDLIDRARTEQQAIMCAESVWWRCHRMLVADALTLRGAQVVHLLAVGRREAHRLHATVRCDAEGWPVYDVPDTLPGLG